MIFVPFIQMMKKKEYENKPLPISNFEKRYGDSSDPKSWEKMEYELKMEILFKTNKSEFYKIIKKQVEEMKKL